MSSLKYVFFIILAGLMFSPVQGQITDSPQHVPAPAAILSTSSLENEAKNSSHLAAENQKAIEEIKADISKQKFQSEVTEKYLSTFFDLIIYSLSMLFTTAALFLGWTGWTNIRTVKADRAAIETEMRTQIALSEKRIVERLAVFEKEIAQITAVSLNSFAAGIASDAAQTRVEMDKIRTDVINLWTSLAKSDSALVANTAASTERTVEVEQEMRRIEETVWSIKGNFSNVWLTQVQGLRIALEHKRRYTVKDLLMRMDETLKNHGSTLDPENFNFITAQARHAIGEAAQYEPVLANNLSDRLDKLHKERESV